MNDNINDFGDLPSGWQSLNLGDIGSFSKGSGIRRADIKDRGLPCITYGEIYTKYDAIVNELDSFISKDCSKQSKLIKSGDILFAGSGETAEEIGKSVVYIGDNEAFAGGDIVILRPEKGIPEYLGHVLNYGNANAQKARLGQGYSVVHIYSSHLEKINIPYPPLNEQQEIAQILSTWDKAIVKTEELISVLEQRKKGLMQRLLTGEVRFPGFDDEWKILDLGLVSEKIQDGNYGPDYPRANDFVKEGVPFINGKALNKSGLIMSKVDYIKDKKHRKITKAHIKYNDVLFTNRGNFGKAALVPREFDGGNIGPQVTLVRTKQNLVDPRYLFYFFQSDLFNKQTYEVTAGSALAFFGLKTAAKLKIQVPTLNEQKQMVKILTICDDEIQLFNKNLCLLHNQKKGLMQRLLTGQVRVQVKD